MTAPKAPQNSLEYTLGRIEGKLDMMIAKQDEHSARLDSAEADIATLKQGRSWLLGAGATVAAGVSAVGAYIFR